MSWLNGQILSPKDLLKTSIELGTRYKHKQRVKLWVDLGSVYQSIDANVVGVSIGAEGSIFYKLALPIGDMGLYSTVEAPSALITEDDVTEFQGPNWVAADDVKQRLSVVDRPKLGLASHTKTVQFIERSALPQLRKLHSFDTELSLIAADVCLGLEGDKAPQLMILTDLRTPTVNIAYDNLEVSIKRKTGAKDVLIVTRDGDEPTEMMRTVTYQMTHPNTVIVNDIVSFFKTRSYKSTATSKPLSDE